MAGQPRKEREVWKACDLLFSAGKPLTYKNIWDTLEELGFRRGNSSDVKKYLDTWRLARGKQYPSAQDASSDEITKAINTIVSNLQQETSKAKLAEMQTSELKQVIEQLQTKQKDSLSLQHTLENGITKIIRAIEKLENKIHENV